MSMVNDRLSPIYGVKLTDAKAQFLCEYCMLCKNHRLQLEDGGGASHQCVAYALPCVLVEDCKSYTKARCEQ